MNEAPQKGNWLVVDQLQAHFDKDAIQWLEQRGIEVAFFPKGGAGELSIMDNSLFRNYKQDYCKLLKEIPTYPTFLQEEKVAITTKVWKAFPLY